LADPWCIWFDSATDSAVVAGVRPVVALRCIAAVHADLKKDSISGWLSPSTAKLNSTYKSAQLWVFAIFEHKLFTR